MNKWHTASSYNLKMRPKGSGNLSLTITGSDGTQAILENTATNQDLVKKALRVIANNWDNAGFFFTIDKEPNGKLVDIAS
jgi:hypothetical protein